MYIDYKVTFSDIRKEITHSQSVKKFLIFCCRFFLMVITITNELWEEENRRNKTEAIKFEDEVVKVKPLEYKNFCQVS